MDLNRYFSKENVQMTKNHMHGYSTLLYIKEMQKRFHIQLDDYNKTDR